jgi:rubrerythrin
MEKYRCRTCGYFHVGPAPEKCPVCGAAQTMFVAYEGPGDLSGTKTLENLAAAFAGESQANRRYSLWARIADREGNMNAKSAFDHAAAEETAHALGHLAYMGGYGETKTNLEAAAAGEAYETLEMYPEFADIAEAEGFPEVAAYFRAVGRFEAEHKARYDKALGLRAEE